MVFFHLFHDTFHPFNEIPQRHGSKGTASFLGGIIEAEVETSVRWAGKGHEEGLVSHSPNRSRYQRRREQGQVLHPQTAMAQGPSRSPRRRHQTLSLATRPQGHMIGSHLQIFALLRKQYWYEPRCQTYARLLMMLGKCRQPEEASLLFEIMLSEGLKPTVDVYTALVSAYGQSGLLDQAFSTVEDMKSVVDCEPDTYTYSILISCCAKFHHFDLIEHVLAEMSYLGIQCNSTTYNSIIDGYGKAGMFERIDNTLNDMIENGNCHPDVFTLNSFVGAYGNVGQIDKMEKWYNEFQLMGIKPDITTFNMMIKSYGKAGMYKKMKSVLDFMERRFFTPTIVTYNTVIEVFGKAGEIDKMDQHFLKMKHLGVKPNSITYCSLVSAYSKVGHIDKVDSIMRHVENSDVVLDTPFFNCIISAYGQAGDLKKMSELFLDMRERKCEPDSITFACMIQAYNTQGMTEAAQKLENTMISAKNSLGMLQFVLL
ncbi:Pentatricopeptide repeat-containing protein, partial [Mucuna pruriens]